MQKCNMRGNERAGLFKRAVFCFGICFQSLLKVWLRHGKRPGCTAKQAHIQGPGNASIARFDGLGRYQISSETDDDLQSAGGFAETGLATGLKTGRRPNFEHIFTSPSSQTRNPGGGASCLAAARPFSGSGCSPGPAGARKTSVRKWRSFRRCDTCFA